MDTNERIAQFEHMCREDPENDMAHFSLGNAYAEAGRHAEAAAAFRRCYEVNPLMSKAYQLAGDNLIKSGQRDKAGPVLLEGYKIASERGDLLPKRAIGALLIQLGIEAPEVKEKAKSSAGGSFVCRRTGRPGSQLPRPPFRGPLGSWIAANISSETWEDWIRQGTKVINELRLDLSRDEDSDTYDKHMREYLGIDDEMLAKIRAGA